MNLCRSMNGATAGTVWGTHEWLRSLRYVLVAVCMAVGVPIRMPAQEMSQAAKELSLAFRRFDIPPDPNHLCRIRFTVSTQLRDTSRPKVATMTCDMSVNRARMSFTTADMAVYQDTNVAFTIIPRTRTVYITQVVGPALQAERLRHVTELRDSLLTWGRVSSSRFDAATGRSVVELALNARGRQRLRAAAITIEIERQTYTIRRMLFSDVTDAKVRSIEYVFERLEYSACGNEFLRPVADQVLSPDGSPRPPYRGYRVIDNRNNRH